MQNSAGLCLSCGAPFAPNTVTIDHADTPVNLSFIHIHKKIFHHPVLVDTVTHPRLLGHKQASHVIHDSHVDAVLFWAEKSRDVRVGGNNMVSHKEGPFMFRMPRNKKKLASWDTPDTLAMSYLYKIIQRTMGDIEINDRINFNAQLPLCCHCNVHGTCRFWFNYHLLSARNNNKLIPFEAINIDSGQHLDDSAQAQSSGSMRPMIPEQNKTSIQYLPAAVAYYLQMCSTSNDPDFFSDVDKDNERPLFTLLCWITLQILCLCCEYARGAEDKIGTGQGTKVRNQTTNHTLGLIELYTSYMMWSVCRCRFAKIGLLTFAEWHQFYVGDVATFHSKTQRSDMTIIADVVMSGVAALDTREALLQLSQNLKKAHSRYFLPLANFIQGNYTGSMDYELFFPLYRGLDSLRRRCMRIQTNDADSIIRNLGADALLNRLIMLCRDMPPDILQMLMDFRAACREKEIRNLERNRRVFFVYPAKVMYKLAKLMHQPPVIMDLAPSILQGLRCSPWKSSQALMGMGAFEWTPAKRK